MNYIYLALLCCAVCTAQSGTIRGFPSDTISSQTQLEAKARSIPDPALIREYMQKMSTEPHIAGSPASKRVAEYAAALLRSWGLETRIEEFEALLPYPTKRALSMTAPSKFTAALAEPSLAEDPDSGDKDQIPTYNAYSASGDVTGQIVYVNYGIPEDYEHLRKLGIDVKGKIALARYGRSWRGTKAKVAQEYGALGCLIYSDPRDDGYFQGDVYPRGPYRPAPSVQRGSVMDMPLFTGDPLSPGWASVKGAKRIPLADATNIMKIPVLPISYEDARPFLETLGGPVAPESWRGALPFTYHIGPGPAAARLILDFDWTTKPFYNVIATISGTEERDQWIIYGNHHDAWVNGANDPVSGAAALLETARTLGELVKTGWKPKRTIHLALWDAEEFGLIGSTEWVEKYQAELDTKGLLYLNSDTNGGGTLSAGGSPSLETFFSEIVRDTGAKVKTKEGESFRLTPVGAGSDYVAFIHHTGIASINAGFSGAESAGVYHSIYDSFNWYSKFSDKNFANGRSLAQIMSTAILRMANSPLLPFAFAGVATAVDQWLEDLRKNLKLDLGVIANEVAALRKASNAYEIQYGEAMTKGGRSYTGVNRILLASERVLLNDAGLPGRPWYKHQLMAPGMYTGYSAKTLPGVRESAEAGRHEEANAQARNVAAALKALTARVQEATMLLQ